MNVRHVCFLFDVLIMSLLVETEDVLELWLAEDLLTWRMHLICLLRVGIRLCGIAVIISWNLIYISEKISSVVFMILPAS